MGSDAAASSSESGQSIAYGASELWHAGRREKGGIEDICDAPCSQSEGGVQKALC